MRLQGKVGEINDVNYLVFNCYRFVYRFAFYYAFDRSRLQELKYFYKNLLTTKGFYVIMIVETR